MLRNYLTVGIRALVKNRTYAFINIFGLAIGMAACLMILLFVRYEMRYDKWVPGWQNAYQVQTWTRSAATGQENQLQMAPYVTGAMLAKDFPQIERTVYALFNQPVFLQDGLATSTDHYLYVNGNFLDVIDLPLASGSRATLDHVGSALMTRSEARKRFGSDNVLGRTFTVISKGKKFDFTIGGILEDLP
jgi:putative ABC transport system permease protein